ncbi:MAG TPA: adventurous gliding motility lipoprotein CglC [Anaeromyxobacter sp.]|nr:adventurous gliding motility lipoprotein CglC [Anaeromyxobacter sp.]
MRAHASFTVLALLTLSALPGCDKPDVGSRCELAWNSNWQQDGTPPPPTPGSIEADYFESGNVACDNLICVVSHALPPSRYASCSGTACGYCSKPCVSDRECYSDETGLYCEFAVLDDAFVASLPPETRTRYLNQFTYSRYCVVPR